MRSPRGTIRVAGALWGKVRARARLAVLAGAAVALSVPVGVAPSRLRPELESIWADVLMTRRKRRTLAAMRSRGMLRTVADLDIAARKRSGTVFILGSGSSVNDLVEADWAVIGGHDSIGFNNWLIHGFVPTFYFVELGTFYAEDDVYTTDLLRRRLADLGDMPIIAESKCWLRPEGFSSRLPRELRDRLHFYAPYSLRTTSVEVVAWVLRRGRSVWRRGSCDLKTMIHHRASLSALVLFAFLAGYEEIVLVGVDLNDSRYFWETDDEFLHGAPGPPVYPGEVHMTVDPAATASEVAVPIDDYLRLLDSTVLRPNGVSLQVANPRSLLSAFLPVYAGLTPGGEADRPSTAGEVER
jgi:hypothetical protein